jgi:type II secretory pathway component PulJ
MRKGFSLLELLAVFVVFTAISFALVPVFATLVGDIPRSYGVVQENTSLLSMLKQMRADIDTARQLPESFAGVTSDDKLLLIESTAGCICYQLKEGEVLRHRLSSAEQGSGEGTAVWSVPHAEVEWQVWRKNSKGYAVEVKTHIRHKVQGRWQKKMANSHLYFVGAFREVLK